MLGQWDDVDALVELVPRDAQRVVITATIPDSVEDLIHWLVTDYGMDPREAYMHTCINPDFRVNVYQYTIGLASVGAELPKRYLV